ncbi:DNA polymerase III subunit gamma and tau [Humibacter sp.]|uniref:DNA polymerase III subunit gamma and tau n=1 Tax=Humibacter sp. TaxID=1940291 RepID=UPI003F7FE7D9
MVTALYRRYRPETFAEMIGQSQVTEPLMTALRTNRVNHAYLFSGPRGCGKTTSARILARCLNCAEGPTDTPCGKCQSCIELGRGGQGSLDVVEIDAASHNGVDDARDIRERAIFAPARDRYKIFILDEAHMVTPQGFNALLKIVEEPPEHVKFIFATTEPDKVIGTIRSRTHHYPFRLVPPAQMLDYVQQLCESEGMSVAPGVLPLVVRAGGGSPRDTLSLLDQLIAGSEGATIEYERAVALLGYTHAALLDEVVDSIGAVDAASAFSAVDRVIQTGQDPRRFVEDLLERLRDLIIVAATSPDAAAAVLRGTPQEELDRMSVQASVFGAAELSRCADIVNSALTEMTGATSPRLHLELMIARMLVPASDSTDRGALARVERLERRVGVQSTVGEADGPAAATARPPAARAAEPVTSRHTPDAAQDQRPVTQDAEPGAAARSATSAWSVQSEPAEPAPARSEPAEPAPARAEQAAPASVDPAVAQAAAFAAAAAAKKGTSAGGASGPAGDASSGGATASSGGAASAWATPGVTDDGPTAPVGPVTTQQVRDAWPEILESVAEASRNAWAVVYTATVRSLDGDVLSLSFPSANDVESFRGTPGANDAASEVLRQSIVDLLGIRVKFVAKAAGLDGGASGGPERGGPGSGGPGNGGPGGPSSAQQVGALSEQRGSDPSLRGPARTGGVAPANEERSRESGPSTAGVRASTASVRPNASAASGSSLGWETVAIPGAATAVLERPLDDTAPDRADDVSGSSANTAQPSSVDDGRSGAAPDGQAPGLASPASSASTSDDEGWYVGPDDEAVPDDEEPPFPDDYASASGSPASGAPAPDTRIPAAAASTDASAPRESSTEPASPSGSQNPNRRNDAGTASNRPKASVGFGGPTRYGEAVVRELLGARFIEEQQITPPSGAGGGASGWQR